MNPSSPTSRVVKDPEVLKLLGIWRGASFACESATGFGKPSKGAPHGDEITCFAAHAGRVDGVYLRVVFPQFQRRTNWLKLATRLIVEEALEGEAGDAVGRDYYEHGAQPGQGYRNGYRMGRLKTAEGAMEYSAPQIAGRDEPFRSAIREHLKGHTQGLEDLAIEMLARGLSVRDIEDAFKDENGRLLLSKTAVSQLGERLWEDYQAFAQRDLSEYEITYLFVDGIAERLRPGGKREPVLAAWGFTIEGRRVLLHMMAGSKGNAEYGDRVLRRHEEARPE